MQLFIRFRPEVPLDLPINYNHILQGFVYRALAKSDPVNSRRLHDRGDQYENRIFKHFTFGPLEGKYQVKNRVITFTDYVFWEFRSYDSDLIEMVDSYIENHGVELGDNNYTDVDTFVGAYEIENDAVQIKARMPIVAYSTDERTRHTYYYTPEEYGFYELTCLNALKRYKNARPDADADIQLVPEAVHTDDKVITTYKGIIIEGWKGNYMMYGTPELLDYLYQTGLGAKNAQGFGMFDVIQPQG